MNNEFETRAYAGIEAREGKLVGYPIVFDSLSEIIVEGRKRFREVIEPDSVRDVLTPEADIRALIDHDRTRVIGRTKAGTLSYEIDAKGVRANIMPPSHAADLIESVERGDIDGMSFRFRPAEDGVRWDYSGDIPIRRIMKMAMVQEFSVVTWPAYPETSVSLRQLEAMAPTSPDMLRKRLKLAELGA